MKQCKVHYHGTEEHFSQTLHETNYVSSYSEYFIRSIQSTFSDAGVHINIVTLRLYPLPNLKLHRNMEYHCTRTTVPNSFYLFNMTVLTAQRQLSWDFYQEWWVGKDLEGSDCELFEGIILTFALRLTKII
jgi:hypothetical protein